MILMVSWLLRSSSQRINAHTLPMHDSFIVCVLYILMQALHIDLTVCTFNVLSAILKIGKWNFKIDDNEITFVYEFYIFLARCQYNGVEQKILDQLCAKMFWFCQFYQFVGSSFAPTREFYLNKGDFKTAISYTGRRHSRSNYPTNLLKSGQVSSSLVPCTPSYVATLQRSAGKPASLGFPKFQTQPCNIKLSLCLHGN